MVSPGDQRPTIWFQEFIEGQFEWPTRIDFRFCSCDTRYALLDLENNKGNFTKLLNLVFPHTFQQLLTWAAYSLIALARCIKFRWFRHCSVTWDLEILFFDNVYHGTTPFMGCGTNFPETVFNNTVFKKGHRLRESSLQLQSISFSTSKKGHF